jgi:thioredoxin reductase (NADPH)
MATNDVRKVAIIGSGPAGYTAAIYAGRANMAPIVFAGPEPGGQLTLTTLVENYPGFAEGVLGPQLMEEMRKQAERFSADVVWRTVTEVDFSQRPFVLKADGETHRAEAVIIASGASARLLGLKSERRLLGRGVSTCATCDGAFFRDQNVIVVGGGDTAMEDAIFLTKFAKKVTVVHRRDQLRASKILQERAFNNPKIDFLWDTVVEDIRDMEAGRVIGVALKNVKTGETFELPIDVRCLPAGDVDRLADRIIVPSLVQGAHLNVRLPVRCGGMMKPDLLRLGASSDIAKGDLPGSHLEGDPLHRQVLALVQHLQVLNIQHHPVRRGRLLAHTRSTSRPTIMVASCPSVV